MTTSPQPVFELPDESVIAANVLSALEEDVGTGDITAALIAEDATAHARIISRERGVLCGRAWVDRVFSSVSPEISIIWHTHDSQEIAPDQALFEVTGPARALLTAERAALNFLQLLSGTATLCQQYASLVEGTSVRLLDTRKTLPGLREAQKYAVRCGGCHNHRMGLYDAFLIKENHILACGSIEAAVAQARLQQPGKWVEVEVESIEELRSAMAAGCDRAMLDNFSLAHMREAVAINANSIELEASGNVTRETLRPIAETGVDFISIGALTKDCKALDLSMRLLN